MSLHLTAASAVMIPKTRKKIGSGLIGQIVNGIFLSVYAAALTPALRSARGQVVLTGESDIGNTICSAVLLVLMIAWVCANFHHVRRLSVHILPYILIVALCLMSCAWSPFFLASVRRSVTLATCVVYGVYLYDTFGILGICKLTTRTALALAVLSIVVFFAVPSIGHDQELTYSTALRGVFSTKNAAGEMMVLGICCTLYVGGQPGHSKAWAILSTLLMLGVLGLTRSATSLLIATSLLGLGCYNWTKSWRMRLLMAFGVACLLLSVAAFAIIDLDAVFGLVGRDSSLTGRLPLWQEVFKEIAKRPLLGYGYSGFWVAESNEVQYLWLKVGWPAPSAHDGYLDIVLQIGLIGLVLYVAMWTRVIKRNITISRLGSVPETVWIASFMVVNVLLNIDEGPLPYPDEFTLMMPACLIFLGLRLQSLRVVSDRPRTRSGRLPIRTPRPAPARRPALLPVGNG